MLGIDTTKTLSPSAFTSILESAQSSRKQATFILADLWLMATQNPEYDDLFHQAHKDSDVGLSTIKKYRATVERFPYHTRKWDVSIDAYYTVKNCDEATIDKLMTDYENGAIKNREDLRKAVSGDDEKAEPIKTTCRVIDLITTLTKDYGLQETDVIDITAKLAELKATA